MKRQLCYLCSYSQSNLKVVLTSLTLYESYSIFILFVTVCIMMDMQAAQRVKYGFLSANKHSRVMGLIYGWRNGTVEQSLQASGTFDSKCVCCCVTVICCVFRSSAIKTINYGWGQQITGVSKEREVFDRDGSLTTHFRKYFPCVTFCEAILVAQLLWNWRNSRTFTDLVNT